MGASPWPTFPILFRALGRGGPLSERKVRLFAVACCRDLREVLRSDAARDAIEAAAGFADREVDEMVRCRALERYVAELGGRRESGEYGLVRREFPAPELCVILALRRDEEFVWNHTGRTLAGGVVAYPWTVSAAADVWSRHAWERALKPARPVGWFRRMLGRWGEPISDPLARPPLDNIVATVDIDRHLARLTTDLFRHHLAPVAFDPAWRTEAVAGLAQGMYESLDFAPMPVLADALEDAGCADADILSHCRKPGLHVRGCWVVDLVLGKG